MPFYGAAMLCIDDPSVRAIMPDVSVPGHQLRLRRGRAGARRRRARRRRRRCTSPCSAATASRCPTCDVMLNLPGEHNVLNALSAIAVARRTRACPTSAMQQGAGGVQRRGPALPALRRASPCRDRRRQLHADRRLRPPPGRDGGDAGRRARRLPGPPPGAGLPAAPLHAHARLLRGLRQGARPAPTRCCWPRSMPPARRRSSPPTAARWRARVRVAGKVEPVFVDDDRRPCRQAIIEHGARRRRGDLMGAGSIGGVPAQAGRSIAERRACTDDMLRIASKALRQGRRADGRHVGRARGLADVGQRRARGAAVARASTRMRSTRPSATSSS